MLTSSPRRRKTVSRCTCSIPHESDAYKRTLVVRLFKKKNRNTLQLRENRRKWEKGVARWEMMQRGWTRTHNSGIGTQEGKQKEQGSKFGRIEIQRARYVRVLSIHFPRYWLYISPATGSSYIPISKLFVHIQEHSIAIHLFDYPLLDKMHW